MEVYYLSERGMSNRDIAKKLGFSRQAVTKWVKNPQHHSPFIDDIAIDRAINGDVEVYNNLSRWEYIEFWKEVRRLAQAELDSGFYSSTNGVEVYRRVASFLGMDVNRVSDRACKLTIWNS
jgi:predicted transcriptional regulator